MNKTTKKLIMYITGAVMACSIFMFFMDVLTWNDSFLGKLDTATPTFFNLMFGTGGSGNPYPFALGFNYTVVPGMLIIFILQVILIVGVLVLFLLTILKKLNDKKTYIGLLILGSLAIVCSILTFVSPTYALTVSSRLNPDLSLAMKGVTKLFYGGIVYGSVMMTAGLVAFVPYVVTYCLKK